MSLSSNLMINLYSIALLIFIFIQTWRNSEKSLLPQKLFNWILIVTILLLLMDILSRFDGNPGTAYAAANQAGNFLIFLMYPVLPSLWLLYTLSQIDNGTVKIRRWLRLLLVLVAANAVMLVLSQFFGWYYTIGPDNIYHRGPLYWLPVTTTVSLTAASFIIVVAHRKRIERKHFVSILLFPVPPLVCIVLQITYYGISLVLNGAAMSILIAFVTIQNERMNTDFLTGAYNRKGLEMYIRQRIAASTENRTFSAILLDLDNFKSINDTFGHNTGDQVLVTTVRLLKKCITTGDIVGRYGGDEFCIILDIYDTDELEKAAHRINCCFGSHNAADAEPFKISFSMGYAVYDYYSHLTAEQFHDHIDGLMYLNKRTGKGCHK